MQRFALLGRIKNVLLEMNILVCVLRHWSLLAMCKVLINRVQVPEKKPWYDVSRADIRKYWER
jgi:hypothetical protein